MHFLGRQPVERVGDVRVGDLECLVERDALEEDPERELYLVRFEGEGAELGPPAGCWPEELGTVSKRTPAEAD
jgi:hypothetical protein